MFKKKNLGDILGGLHSLKNDLQDYHDQTHEKVLKLQDRHAEIANQIREHEDNKAKARVVLGNVKALLDEHD